MTHGSAPCDGEDATLLRSVGRRNQKQNRGDDRSSIGDSILPLALRHEIGYSRVEAEGEHMADPSPRLDLPQGTLDLLILKAIALDPQHGWAISERIQQISNNALQVNQGSLYPALHRLERRGWIKAAWDVSDNNRRAKYYELTKKGRKQLEEQTDAWRALNAAINLLLDHS